MKYYVVSDVHGFYSLLEKALRDKGFFNDTEPHKLVVCGDMLDRGNEALEMSKFMLQLLHNDELIFIRGNHEDLLLDMLKNFEDYRWDITMGTSHHISNDTFSSALQLSQMDETCALRNTQEFIYKVENSDFCKELIPASKNYFETEHYIFVHGWIPCVTDDLPAWYRKRSYKSNPDWRSASPKDWERARWYNGMDLALQYNIVEPEKKIVCGHWHASYGHNRFHQKCSEWGADADFTPFVDDHIIAVDACTAHSGFVNCVVLED